MRTFGLIGYPLGHSFSERFFTEKFERENIREAVYKTFELASLNQFKSLISENANLRGLNVTIPYKTAILRLLDEVNEEAKSIGAVNCIDIRDGRTLGYNTDSYGFKMSIKPFLENKFERALILGNGGSSQAVQFVLKSWNIPFFVVTRNKKAGNYFDWNDLSGEMMQHFKLIINTTPLGMSPNVEQTPDLPYDSIGPDHFLYDLIYNPIETKFLRMGRQQGASIMNGQKMLEWQALKSWEIWNGQVT